MRLVQRLCPPRWLTALTAFIAVSGLVLVLNPGAAHAGVIPGRRVAYTLISSVPTFNVADGRTIINTLGAPISATFTSNQSRTFTVSASIGTSASFLGFLTAEVSASATLSRTTEIGISATVTVPAGTRVVGEYGVEAFIITYDAQDLVCLKTCSPNGGPRREIRNVPTIIEGWRFIQTPA